MRAIPVIVVLDGLDMDAVRLRFEAGLTQRGPDDCWPWAGETGPRGYGVVTVHLGGRKRRRVLAHRLALFLLGGVDPGELGALHSCDNPPCCNPRHLRAGTAAENAADKIRRGRANHPISLSPDQVAEIRRRYAEGVSSADLAAAYGVSQSQAHKVAVGESRAEVPAPVGVPPWKALGHVNSNGKLTDGDVTEIRRRYAVGDISKRRLAMQFGVSARHVADILSGKRRRAA